MNNLKFRVRNKINGEIVNVDHLHFKLETGQLYTKRGLNMTEHYIIEQFIGVHDTTKWEDRPDKYKSIKKEEWCGVEIYEGDIAKVRSDWNRGVAEDWCEGSIGFIGFDGGEFFHSTSGLDDWELECEVIGNIHDNPELLNS